MQILAVDEATTSLEVHEIITVEKRKHGQYLHTADGNIYDFNEFVNEPKSACKGDYILIEDDGSVACEKKLQFETLLETLIELKVPHTYA